jgi:hypothetical protein
VVGFEVRIELLMRKPTVKLSAHFILWAASPEAAFAAGRFLWCEWDVTQLKAEAKKFQEDQLFLTTGILGWPFRKTLDN